MFNQIHPIDSLYRLNYKNQILDIGPYLLCQQIHILGKVYWFKPYNTVNPI